MLAGSPATTWMRLDRAVRGAARARSSSDRSVLHAYGHSAHWETDGGVMPARPTRLPRTDPTATPDIYVYHSGLGVNAPSIVPLREPMMVQRSVNETKQKGSRRAVRIRMAWQNMRSKGVKQGVKHRRASRWAIASQITSRHEHLHHFAKHERNRWPVPIAWSCVLPRRVEMWWRRAATIKTRTSLELP